MAPCADWAPIREHGQVGPGVAYLPPGQRSTRQPQRRATRTHASSPGFRLGKVTSAGPVAVGLLCVGRKVGKLQLESSHACTHAYPSIYLSVSYPPPPATTPGLHTQSCAVVNTAVALAVNSPTGLPVTPVLRVSRILTDQLTLRPHTAGRRWALLSYGYFIRCAYIIPGYHGTMVLEYCTDLPTARSQIIL